MLMKCTDNLVITKKTNKTNTNAFAEKMFFISKNSWFQLLRT